MFTKRELRIKDVYCVILQDHDDDGDHNDELDTYYDEDVAPRYLVSEQVPTLKSSNCWSILSFGIPSYQVFHLENHFRAKSSTLSKRTRSSLFLQYLCQVQRTS